MSVEFLMMLRMVCLKLFPSLICFDENADRGWKGGRTNVHSLCVGSIGLELITRWYVGRRCAVKVLSKHGSNTTVCINSHWSKDHLVVEKITDDIITIGGVVLRLFDLLSLFCSWSCRERSALAV